jgi:ribosomal protein S6--L-glutamate ligase
MKLLMLCREPRLYSCQRLKRAAEENGHQMDILDPNRCLIKLRKNPPHFALYYQAEPESEAQLLPQYDAVLPRFGTTSMLMGYRVLHYFQALGIPCLNHVDAFRNARDKWLSLQMLLQHGIAVPDSLLAGMEVDANHAVQHIGAPTILKTLTGSQGIGVILAERAQSAVSILDTLKQSDVPVLLQEFVAESNGTDLRCFVIGGRVVAAMQRIERRVSRKLPPWRHSGKSDTDRTGKANRFKCYESVGLGCCRRGFNSFCEWSVGARSECQPGT